jgi:plastocyanin
VRALGTVKYGLWNGGAVSPLRPGRRLSSLVVFGTILLAAVLGAAAGGVEAQGQAAAPRQVYLAPQEDSTKCPGGNGPCWDIPVIPVNPGEDLQIIIDLSHASQPHDFHVKDATGTELGHVPAQSTIGGTYTLNITIPSGLKGSLDYFCSVHPKTMVGKLTVVSALGATEAPAIPELGVSFLAYWVGTIAFMLLFLVYGLTFFLFKYNETPATTDHWDRVGAEGQTENPRMRGGYASLLALGLAILVIVLVVAAARYLR